MVRCGRCHVSEVLNYGDACSYCATMMRIESRPMSAELRQRLLAMDIQRQEMLLAVERRADVARLYRERQQREAEEELRTAAAAGATLGWLFGSLFGKK